ncbi:hypothetical protein [Streptomyces antarcticus]|uniref:hypothetical protein n=1 Tax=Streptomyces antarcticus TaxID=2996458 RepID=UPI0022705FF2|nr:MULTISPECIES: hypothetical protein [unclassified Streptomyces]MCY0947587.1 hypothetical protein [Streptomyces sp. H34-AA3]MCZ4087543.1 hypothetical protein [Streptomyces sp. H34-S5]
MNRHSRRTTVTSLVACSFFAGSLVALAPAATAAPAIGTCTVKTADNGLSITISGSGWDPKVGLKIDGGEGVDTLPVKPDGTFSLVRFQKSTDFTVLPDTGGFRNCQVLKADSAQKETDKNAIRKARQQGFNEGVKAGKQAAQEDCDSKPKPHKKPGLTAQDAAVEAAFAQGFLAGAQSAFAKFCRT